MNFRRLKPVHVTGKKKLLNNCYGKKAMNIELDIKKQAFGAKISFKRYSIALYGQVEERR